MQLTICNALFCPFLREHRDKTSTVVVCKRF
uniref:Uncharacterized protein n=1 Tax=Anguilla anguilla TaxID=7936 RepID=A0A0E9V2I8_ANGAN